MRPVEDWLADYAAGHRTRGNEICHFVGMPLIVVGTLGLLARVALVFEGGVRLDLAMAVAACAIAFYGVLSARLAFLALLAAIGLYAWGLMLPLAAVASAFVAGWILQIVGHAVFEKNRPALLQNAVHLLIGPLYLLNRLAAVVPPEPRGDAPSKS
jgi:uncharacterized membrane protein YGL010W